MRVLALLLTAWSLAAPAWAAGPQAQPTRLVFPPPPDEARIEYLGTLSRIQDLRGGPPGFFRRLFDAAMGRQESEALLLARPFGVAAGKGLVYASDSTAGVVVVFDRVLKKAWPLGRDSAQAALSNPMGLALDREGRLYVADSVAAKIMVYDTQGRFLSAIGKKGAGEGMLSRPVGLAWDRVLNRILVSDAALGRVLAFSPQGEYLSQIGSKGDQQGQFSVPVGLAVDSKGRVIVADSILCRVQVFDAAGRFLSAFGSSGDTLGHFGRPKGLAVDSDDNIYVVDSLFSVVQIFDAQGRLLMHFGREGDMAGTFQIPTSIAIDELDGIHVADSMNRRVEEYRYLKVPPSQKEATAQGQPVSPIP